jgi:FkbM family methyltransferase
MSQPSIAFDRDTARLDGASLVERGAVLALRAVAKATWPFYHRGYSVFCRLVTRLIGSREIVVRLNEDALFAFPLGDGYWSRLLDRDDTYEPDLDHFLRRISGVDYVFVDCGANFGIWSVLVSSRPFGSHPTVAIEASSSNTRKLERNAQLNGDRFQVLHRAVSGANGGTAWLSGHKHEAFSIADAGARGSGEEVAVISLDGLLDSGAVRAGQRAVVKLDVEGVEIEAMKGGARLLAGEVIVICEDHGSDAQHTVTRYLMNEASYRVYMFDHETERFERLSDLAALDRIKVAKTIGYNVFATASRFWEDQLLSKPPTAH